MPARLAAALAALAVIAAPAISHAAIPNIAPGAVVLFQGDSITEGGRWRSEDPNHSMGQDYAYIVAAQIGRDAPEKRLVFVNRGISGNTVADLTARWQSDTLDLKPDVLSLLVGVNDTFYGKGETLEQFAAGYEALIARTQAALPQTRILLGQPFLLPVGSYKAGYAEKRAQVEARARVVEQIAARHHLPLIRYQAAFDAALTRAPAEHWSWDGVHPTFAGHGLMAEVWMQAANEAFR